jgi:hypothetical protein
MKIKDFHFFPNCVKTKGQDYYEKSLIFHNAIKIKIIIIYIYNEF